MKPCQMGINILKDTIKMHEQQLGKKFRQIFRQTQVQTL